MSKWRRPTPKDVRKNYKAAQQNAHAGGAKTFGSTPETKTWKCLECGSVVLGRRDVCDCGAKKPETEPESPAS